MDLLRTLELPQDVILKMPLITMVGSCKLHVENFSSILEFTDILIRLKTYTGILDVTGKHLKIESFLGDEITITGYIKGICYV